MALQLSSGITGLADETLKDIITDIVAKVTLAAGRGKVAHGFFVPEGEIQTLIFRLWETPITFEILRTIWSQRNRMNKNYMIGVSVVFGHDSDHNADDPGNCSDCWARTGVKVDFRSNALHLEPSLARPLPFSKPEDGTGIDRLAKYAPLFTDVYEDDKPVLRMLLATCLAVCGTSVPSFEVEKKPEGHYNVFVSNWLYVFTVPQMQSILAINDAFSWQPLDPAKCCIYRTKHFKRFMLIQVRCKSHNRAQVATARPKKVKRARLEPVMATSTTTEVVRIEGAVPTPTPTSELENAFSNHV
jgi:hypothetical protein